MFSFPEPTHKIVDFVTLKRRQDIGVKTASCIRLVNLSFFAQIRKKINLDIKYIYSVPGQPPCLKKKKNRLNKRKK